MAPRNKLGALPLSQSDPLVVGSSYVVLRYNGTTDEKLIAKVIEVKAQMCSVDRVQVADERCE